MRIFKTKVFAKFANKEKLSDSSLCEAIKRTESGLINADLGGNLIKQRVCREGQGRSGGYRILIAFRTQKRAVFMYGFAKNERDNIDDNELKSLKELAAAFLNADNKTINQSIENGSLQEVLCLRKKAD